MKRFLILISLVAAMTGCAKKDYHDSSLPAAKRAALLLKEMTLEEKVGQMCQYVAPCYVPPGQGSPYKNIDASDENLGNKDLADKIRRGEVGSFLHCLTTKEGNALQKLAQESRLGIPLLLGIDAIHGNGLIEGCTIYPTNINMASTFNPEIMEVIGEETADEMRQTGMYWTFGPNLDVARDARWGRMGETFGEDAFLTAEMGKYSVWGLQGRDRGYSKPGDSDSTHGHVIACAKHLIAGGEPFGGLNASPMDISERKLREIFLPPFEAAVVEGGAATVMAAHNEVNGIPCHGNKWLLEDLLRKELGFDGFVVSDWMDIERLHAMHHWVADSTEAFVRSVEAGIDMHMQGDKYFEAIIGAVKSGRIPQKRIDEAAGKIIEAKFALGLFENPVPEITTSIERTAEHRMTSLKAARQGIVLLTNDGTLPLKEPRRIFVTGPNADSQTILGDWASPQKDDDVITVLEGLRQEFPAASIDTLCFGGRIAYVDDSGIAAARRKAAAADVNIVVVGENSQRYSAFGRTCGENCDRDNLQLPGRQQELLEAVQATGKPTVVVLLTGRALSLGWAKENVNALVNAWEPGQMGGQAIAEVLSGKVNPSGKLPVTVPRNVGQVQTVYNYKHSQYSRQFATSETGCLWPFGFGMSYSSFAYGEPRFDGDAVVDPAPAEPASGTGVAGGSKKTGSSGNADNIKASTNTSIFGTKTISLADLPLKVAVNVRNDGPLDGDEVIQLYIRDEYASVTRPVKELKGFKRVSLKNGETKAVEFEITEKMLQCWGADEEWKAEPGDFTILLGSSSADSDLKGLKLTLE